MGDPKKLRKKSERAGAMWNTERIKHDHGLRDKYDLRKIRELWLAESELRRIRKNARDVLAGRSKEEIGRQIINRLERFNIVKKGATLDDLLVIDVESLLERRLQTLVYRKGLARTMKQSRQLIAHGLITIGGRRVTAPGYFVPADEETAIGYYKPIKIEPVISSKTENGGNEGAEQVKGEETKAV